MRGLDIHIGKGCPSFLLCPNQRVIVSNSDEECMELYFLGDVVCRNEFEKKLSSNIFFY
jgi:hypothetical protein